MVFCSCNNKPGRTGYVDDAREVLATVGQELLVAERDHHLERKK